MNKILIFWDIDGTLMYCGSDGTNALNETFFELYHINNAFEKAGIGRSVDAVIIDEIMKKFDVAASDIDLIKSKYIEKLEKILEDDNTKKVLPGIRELLFYAERRGHVNSLLTSNLKKGAHTKLNSVNLKEHFIGGGFGDIRGEKWNIADHALKEIETITGYHYDAQNIIIIGDSVYDIKTAKKLGYNVIAVATGWTDYQELEKAGPDILFENFSDADAVMEVIDEMSKGI